MSKLQDKKNFQQQLLEGFEKRTGEPEWLFEIRKNACERFRSLGFPSRKHEAWKYIYLESLLQMPWNSTPDGKSGKNTASLALGKIPGDDNRLVFVNDVLQSDRSQLSKTFQSLVSIRLDDQSSWTKDLIAQQASLQANAFVSINTFQFREGVFLRIPTNTSIETPLHLVFSSEGENRAIYPRILVSAEEGAAVKLVIHIHGGSSGRAFANGVAEFFVGRNANISCVVRQQETPSAFQFLNLKARLQEGANFDVVNYSAGGSMIRNETFVDLEGANTYASSSGLAVLSGNSQVFQHIQMNHKVAHCTSRQNYKNILAGKSVAEFNSMVHVGRDAQKSDSQQLDKNLLLSEMARIYSRPQLKIDNDDVSANHGAATGQLNPKELFYLQSRGIPPEQARTILVCGFAQQILESVKPEILRRELENDMESRVRAILDEERSWK